MRISGGQTLGEEAACVVRQAVSLAGRRGHAQVTPLHMASAMLSASPACVLRAACVRSQSYTLHHNALDLCFEFALDRLAVAGSGGGGDHVEPAPSNAFTAALKRAQVHGRRGVVGGDKVELEQLVVSILDDPSVDRVIHAAGFSSSQCIEFVREVKGPATSSVTPLGIYALAQGEEEMGHQPVNVTDTQNYTAAPNADNELNLEHFVANIPSNVLTMISMAAAGQVHMDQTFVDQIRNGGYVKTAARQDGAGSSNSAGTNNAVNQALQIQRNRAIVFYRCLMFMVAEEELSKPFVTIPGVVPIKLSGTALKKQIRGAIEADLMSAIIVLFSEVDRKWCEHLSLIRKRHYLPKEFVDICDKYNGTPPLHAIGHFFTGPSVPYQVHGCKEIVVILHDELNWVCYTYDIKGPATEVYVYDPSINGSFANIDLERHHRRAYKMYLSLAHCMATVLRATIPARMSIQIVNHTGGPGQRPNDGIYTAYAARNMTNTARPVLNEDELIEHKQLLAYLLMSMDSNLTKIHGI